MVLHNFIVFEGLDGSGTTTQLSLLKNILSDKKTWFTAEPTDQEIGKFLRKILQGSITVQPETLAYLFAADRCEHIHGINGIECRINDGYTVFCDRYLFSSLAYQSPQCGSKLPMTLNEDFPLPEYLIYFDINSELSLSRVASRNGETEIFEKSDIQKITQIEYERIIQTYKENKPEEMKIISIDAAKPVEEVHKIILDSLKNLPIIKE